VVFPTSEFPPLPTITSILRLPSLGQRPVSAFAPSFPLPPRILFLTSLSSLFLSTYHLWTDSTSRHFVARHYPSFLATFDSYAYPIQRADAIRYFVLHRFGGIYMDLDIGCKRDMAPLLRGDWDVVLAKTIPVSLVVSPLFVLSRGSVFSVCLGPCYPGLLSYR
jgi:hypothetical protein